MPVRITVDSFSGSSIAILWDRVECLERNSEITGYRVEYGRTEEDRRMGRQLREVEVENIAGTGAENRRFMATGLLPRTSYTFNVMAVNSEGQTGPPAEIMGSTSMPEGIIKSGYYCVGILSYFGVYFGI